MPEPKDTFEATLYRIGGNRCVDVPAEVSQRHGEGQTVPVRVTVARVTASSSLVPRKGGGHRLFLGVDLRRAAGADAGDAVTVTIEPDPTGGEPELPAALLERLAVTPGGMEALLARSPSDRRQLVRWLEAPKSEGARRSRVKEAVQRILTPPPHRS